MKAEELYEGITRIEEELILEAEQQGCGTSRRRRRWVPAMAAAACAALCAVLWVHPGFGRNTDNATSLADQNGQGGSIESASERLYQHYAGPILPLDVPDGKGVSAEREVELDISGPRLAVTDRYTLTAGQEQTVTLLYPFVSSLWELEQSRPVLMVAGAATETRLYAGAYAGGYQGVEGIPALNLLQPQSWADYAALLSDERYRQEALEPAALPDIPVVVYRFTGAETPGSLPAGTVGVDVRLSGGSTILTYGFNGWQGGEGGRSQYSYFIVHDSLRALVVLGGDAAVEAVGGYRDGSCNEAAADIVLPAMTREETTLAELLREAARDFSGGEDDPLLLQGAAQLLTGHGLLAEQPAARYEIGMLEELFSDARAQQRVFYLTAEVTLTAEEPLEAVFAFEKEAGYDYIPQNGQRRGYELATRLGSGLRFSGQWAVLTGWEDAKLTEECFGFDPEGGITRVALTEERYLLELAVGER